MNAPVFLTIVAIISAGFNPTDADNAHNLIVFKRVNCTPFCHAVRCAQASIDKCAKNEALIGGDGDCYCCDSCVSVRKPQEPGDCNCASVSCAVLTPAECLDKDEAFVPADGVCSCCAACVKPTTIPSH